MLKSKNYLSFREMKAEFEKRPKVEYLWGGIKEKSFGLVFGPSKSGKTIFSENLAMSLAVGRDSFFGKKLSGKPKKVFFIGLEEYWESRAERNLSQYSCLNDSEQDLLNENYLYQAIDFSKYIHRKQDWNNLAETIKETRADIVFIDSITRMNHGSLEDSKTAEQIMLRLRNICYDLSITLICVHHTPKMYDKSITTDCIKGSSVFAQESDFAIGINKTTKGFRYLKNVFFRYAPDDDETVIEFEINDSIWLNQIAEVDEHELLNRNDRRRKDDKRQAIVEYLDSNASSTYTTSELVSHLKGSLKVEERMFKNYLKDLNDSGKINGATHGIYCSINYVEGDERDRK
jgi:KaiC/GvpD/RAD55 family RecA-like ATPase